MYVYDMYTSSLLRENLVEIPNFALHYSDKGKISEIRIQAHLTSLLLHVKHKLVTTLTFIHRKHCYANTKF